MLLLAKFSSCSKLAHVCPVGDKKTCRSRLSRHNNRRKRAHAEGMAASGPGSERSPGSTVADSAPTAAALCVGQCQLQPSLPAAAKAAGESNKQPQQACQQQRQQQVQPSPASTPLHQQHHQQQLCRQDAPAQPLACSSQERPVEPGSPGLKRSRRQLQLQAEHAEPQPARGMVSLSAVQPHQEEQQRRGPLPQQHMLLPAGMPASPLRAQQSAEGSSSLLPKQGEQEQEQDKAPPPPTCAELRVLQSIDLRTASGPLVSLGL